MVQYFKNIERQTVEIRQPEQGAWINIMPPLKQEEFEELSNQLDIPIDFLRDSLDIDERSRYELDDNNKLIVIKTPAENHSFNESDAYYITIPICIILTHQQIVTVNSFDNDAIKKFFNTFQNRKPDNRKMMVLKILEKVVVNYMDFLKEINNRRNMLEQKLYQGNSNEDLLELVRIQKSMVYFVTALRSNELLMIKLERTNILGLNEEERDFLKDLIVDTSQAYEMANIYTNILSSSLDAYASIISNNQNVVLKRLTYVTIALQIPILAASIYGMNVPLPFQDSHYAFWVPIILSAITGLWFGWYYVIRRAIK
ncbi:MAG: magnesium transporter CorA family protein [Chitinophagaceae bacterium]|nr:magnesium transporter CorA family protein [Chitinophagaceae bacterium]